MNAIAKTKRRPINRQSVNLQVRRAKVVLRALRETLEDLEDRNDLARAKARNAGKPGKSWASVKKEFGFDF